jgi:type III secretory pathway component EscR
MVLVMNLARNALEVQQVRPCMVLNGLTIMLRIDAMFPVVKEIGTLASGMKLKFDSLEKTKSVANTLQKPIQIFLAKHAHEKNQRFF